MGRIISKVNLADRSVFAAIRAIENPNAIFALYAMFAMIVTGCFVSGVCPAPF